MELVKECTSTATTMILHTRSQQPLQLRKAKFQKILFLVKIMDSRNPRESRKGWRVFLFCSQYAPRIPPNIFILTPHSLYGAVYIMSIAFRFIKTGRFSYRFEKIKKHISDPVFNFKKKHEKKHRSSTSVIYSPYFISRVDGVIRDRLIRMCDITCHLSLPSICHFNKRKRFSTCFLFFLISRTCSLSSTVLIIIDLR